MQVEWLSSVFRAEEQIREVQGKFPLCPLRPLRPCMDLWKGQQHKFSHKKCVTTFLQLRASWYCSIKTGNKILD